MLLVKLKSLVGLISAAGIRVLVFTTAMLGTTMVLYSGYSLYEQIYTQNRAFSSGSLQYEEGTSLSDVQESFAEEREDYRAWLRVMDTHINYPVMQAKDDLYYANHDVDGKSSLTGAIYLASANKSDLSDNYILVFGHHMDNGAMFGDLDHFLNADFFEKHQEGEFVFPGGAYDVHLFAVLETDAYDEMVYTAGNKDMEKLLSYISLHAGIQKPQVAKDATKIIALSTCAGATTNGRLVLFGVLTPVEEPAPTEEPIPTKEPEVTEEPTPSASAEISGEVTPSVEPQPTSAADPIVTGEVTPTSKPTPTGKPNGGPDAPKTGEHSTAIGKFFDRFLPGGSSYGYNAWALVNLICVLATIYIVFPIHNLRAKYGRIEKMKKVNAVKTALWNAEGLTPTQLAERETILQIARRTSKGDKVTREEFGKAVERRYYRIGSFAMKFTIGIAVEVAVAAVAFLTFVNTENMRLPMILIDKWTPLMLLFMITCWVADVALTRYRVKEDATE
ncbi:MAG: sortase [Lachnospiraceae bacterium]|nr:sortase [Lachnospiraceae bacterium]